jgi:hypothetical protein
LSRDLRWQSLENGALLDAAEQAEFDVLVTCDQNMHYQQNFTNRRLAIVVLTSNQWPIIRPVAAKVASAVDFVQRGQVIRIDLAI